VHLFGPPEVIGATLRRRVRDEVGLPISVGAASTKHLAKIASQVAKPDGLVVVPVGEERAFLDPLPVGLVWGIGPVTRQRLADRGIHTIGQLAVAPEGELRALLGRVLGPKLGALAANDDRRRVQATGRAGSVGAQSALGRRAAEPELLRVVLGHLADRVAGRLRAKQRAGRTVTVRVRFASMRSVTRSHTGPHPISTTLTLAETAERLVAAALADHPDEHDVSLLAISVGNLVDQPVLQLELPLLPDDADRPGSRLGAARWAADHAVDEVRRRFGRAAVGYASVALSEHGSVPDEFRELAEHEL
jgi:DNA polymerase IV